MVFDENSLEAKVRNVLLTIWDPIRVQGFPERLRSLMLDEYNTYIPAIIAFISSGSEKSVIERHLVELEATSMGHERGDGRAAIAAQALFELGTHPEN